MTTRAPETLGPADHWSNYAACRRINPDLMDPDGEDKDGIRYAKGVCNSCPVKDACLADALEEEGNRDPVFRAGIRGGLTTTERTHHYRFAAAIAATDQATKDVVGPLLRKGLSNSEIAKECGLSVTTVRRIRQGLGIAQLNASGYDHASPAEAFAARTTPAGDGHLDWIGSYYFKIRGVKHTARKVGFRQGHGRDPVGQVHTVCSRDGCVAPAHLADQTMRNQRSTTKALSA